MQPLMFFDTAAQVLRVLVVGTLAYAGLVVVVRAAGPRTLAKLNAFDLVVTVALGSTLATVLLSSDVSYVEGMTGLALLVFLQVAVAWSSVRVRALRRATRSRPHLLLDDGKLDEAALRAARVAPEEVRQAVRSSGQGDLERVRAVVLETDGTLSVIPRSSVETGSALADVRPAARP